MQVLSEADLHGLVDGHLDPDRRAEVLRRAAASPRDRSLVEMWKDQNDLIRSTFAGVEQEPVPSALDLRRPAQLRAVPLPAMVACTTAVPRWRRSAGIAAMTVVVALGLVGSWFIASRPVEPPASILPKTFADDGERLLAKRTVSALAFGEIDPRMPSGTAEPPPTSIIPDLSSVGFTFLDAEARGSSPRYVVFRYRDSADARVAIGVSRTDGIDEPPERHETGYIWRSGRVNYAVFGTVAHEKLYAIVGLLRNEVQPN